MARYTVVGGGQRWTLLFKWKS